MPQPGLDVCAACGQRMKHFESNHHCDPGRLRRVEAARLRWQNRKGAAARPTYSERLAAGFAILHQTCYEPPRP